MDILQSTVKSLLSVRTYIPNMVICSCEHRTCFSKLKFCKGQPIKRKLAESLKSLCQIKDELMGSIKAQYEYKFILDLF